VNTAPPIQTNSAARAAAAASGPLFKDQARSASQQLRPIGGGDNSGRPDAADFAEWPPLPQHDDGGADQAYGGAAGVAAASHAATMRKQGASPSYKDQMRGAAVTTAAATVGKLDGTKPASTRGGQGGPSYKDQMRGAAAAAAAKQQEHLAKGGRRGDGEDNDTAAMSSNGPAAPTASSPSYPKPRPQRRDAPRASVSSANPDGNAFWAEAELVVENNDPAPLLVQATEVKPRRYAVVAGLVAVVLAVIGATVGVVCGGVAGSSCRKSSSSSSRSLPACNVTVAVDCRVLSYNGGNDTACADLRPPITASCLASYPSSNGTIATATTFDVLQFSYDNSMLCNTSRHSQGADADCIDHGPTQRGDAPVQVKCYPYIPVGPNCTCCLAEQTELAVSPVIVRTGQLITVSHAQTTSDGRRRSLPHKIKCTMSTPAVDAVDLQTIIVDVSGRVGLNLGDRFGVLQVQTCGNRTCLEQILYTVELRNVGRDPLVLVDASIEIVPGAGFDIPLSDPLNADGVTVSQQEVTISTCSGLAYNMWATVQARSTMDAAETCQHGDSLSFAIDPLPLMQGEMSTALPDPSESPAEDSSSAACRLFFTVDCTFDGLDCFSGLPCSTPSILITPCATPPSSFVMMFGGWNCNLNLGYLPHTCQDFNGGPPSGTGDRAHILVRDDDGTNVFFNGTVTVGDYLRIEDAFLEGFNFRGYAITVTISSANDDPEQRVKLQEIRFVDTACFSEPLSLAKGAGALQLIRADISNELIVPVEYGRDISVPLIVTSSESGGNGSMVELTRLVLETNFAGTLELTSTNLTNATIAPAAGTVAVTLSGTVDVSYRQEYTMQISYSGVRVADGAPCDGSAGTLSWFFGADPFYYGGF
jgi:hypothetical protein